MCFTRTLEHLEYVSIDGQEYMHLGQDVWYQDVYLFEDTVTQKVYRHIYGESRLLYDFNISVGDTTEVHDPFYDDYSYVVTEIDTLTTADGIQRRRWFLSGDFWEATWVEGIGNIQRSLLFHSEGNGLWTRLLCFSQDGLELEGYDCGAVGLTELDNSHITLSPNPMTTSGVLDVGELKGSATLEIFDISGKLRSSGAVNLDSGILNIQRGELASGSYLLRVISEGNALELPFMVE